MIVPWQVFVIPSCVLTFLGLGLVQPREREMKIGNDEAEEKIQEREMVKKP